jgi:hypothetical protein
MFGPQVLSHDTNQLYQMLSQSPQFASLLGQNAVQGQQFQGNLSSSLAQRGLSTSGIGSIAGAAGQSAIQSGESALRGGLFGQAGSLAQQNLLARLQAYQGFQQAQIGQPSKMQEFSGDILGALSPLLMQQGQQPQIPFGFNGPTQQYQSYAR